MSVETSPWTLTELQAALRFGSLVGHVEISSPRQGLSLDSIKETDFAATLFGITGSADETWRARDQYVRQPDAIVAYDVNRTDDVSRTLYWRCETHSLNGSACDQISCLVSLDTQELDTHPRVALRSILPASETVILESTDGEAWQTVATSFEKAEGSIEFGSGSPLLVQKRGVDWSLAIAIHPSDLGRTTITREKARNRIAITHDLVTPMLEKGVIRRLRAAAVCLPREGDVELASKWYSQFAEAAPPLTT